MSIVQPVPNNVILGTKGEIIIRIDAYAEYPSICFSSLEIQSNYKGIDIIIDVCNNYFATNDNLHLIIAGKNQNIDYSSISNIKNVTIVNERL